jgi:simple sugar transport system permease protein
MQLLFERRPERSRAMMLLSPVIALVLTALVGAVIFALRGLNPLQALYIYFIEPLTTLWAIEQLLVKAAPLILIGVGLSIAYIANVWNIGAEGQFTLGAIFGSILPVYFPAFQSPLVLPLMLLLGIAGGMLWGFIPAYLKNRFSANEILTSLMLVYAAGLLLDWLVRGPWRDPQGYNFPKTVTFEGWQMLPTIGPTVHVGVILALIVALSLAFLLDRTIKGFEIRVLGNAPRAGSFAGFSREKMVLFCFLLSGGLAGLAGVCEIASTVGQLQPSISPGYGFTAIIVAFLGRLNPIGVIIAGLILALSYMGGEAAQVTLGISDKIAKVFQGILLFFILACDSFILYRLRFIPRRPLAELAPAE